MWHSESNRCVNRVYLFLSVVLSGHACFEIECFSGLLICMHVWEFRQKRFQYGCRHHITPSFYFKHIFVGKPATCNMMMCVSCKHTRYSCMHDFCGFYAFVPRERLNHDRSKNKSRHRRGYLI